MDRSRGGEVACYIRKSLSYNHQTSFCRNTESIFIDPFLLKSKPILVGVLYRPPDKPDFIEHLNNSLKESNISNNQECYLIGDLNVNLLSGNKMLLKKQYSDSYSQAPPIVNNYTELCFSHSLHQLIMKPTRTTEHTKTLIDHILTNSSENVIQSGVIEMGLSDHELVYCSKKRHF